MSEFSEFTRLLEDKFSSWKGSRPFISEKKFLSIYQAATTELLENFFFDLCIKAKVEQFVECGAYDAYASRLIKQKLPDIPVVAYEANPYVYENFKGEIFAFGVKYINKAISNSISETNLVIKRKDTKSWSNEGFLEIVSNDKSEMNGIQVETTFLDIEVGSSLMPVISGLWIDVEGANRVLIEGAQTFIKSGLVEMIYVESQIDKVWVNDFTAEELCSKMSDLGFSLLARDCPFHWGCNLLFVKSGRIEEFLDMKEEFIASLDSVKIPYFAKFQIRTFLSKFKSFFLEHVSVSHQKKMHKFFSLIGSKSSSDELKN